MTTEVLSSSVAPAEREAFQTERVLTIAGGHFVHDTYSAFISPLLPLLIQKLSLSLTAAGALTIFIQLPSLFQPFIGYLADRVSLRYFIILAPAITATLLSVIGLAPSYTVLAVVLLVAGVSVAAFHAPAPAMIGRVAGRQIGKGMSIFMFAGEMGRFAGPILITAAVSLWTLERTYPVVIPGWLASLVLYWRLRDVAARPGAAPGRRASPLRIWRSMARLMLLLGGIVLARAFMLVTLTTYLPTYLYGLFDQETSGLWLANSSLAILELAGAAGALFSGTLSDRWGRARVLTVALVSAPLLMALFVTVDGWLLFPLLILLGLSALSTAPVLMAIVQEQHPDNRATANGLFLSLTFLVRSGVVLIVGSIGDAAGLRAAFLISALVALLSLPLLRFLPTNK